MSEFNLQMNRMQNAFRYAISIAIHPEAKNMLVTAYRWILHPDELETAMKTPESDTVKMYREAHQTDQDRHIIKLEETNRLLCRDLDEAQKTIEKLQGVSV